MPVAETTFEFVMSEKPLHVRLSLPKEVSGGWGGWVWGRWGYPPEACPPEACPPEACPTSPVSADLLPWRGGSSERRHQQLLQQEHQGHQPVR